MQRFAIRDLRQHLWNIRNGSCFPKSLWLKDIESIVHAGRGGLDDAQSRGWEAGVEVKNRSGQGDVSSLKGSPGRHRRAIIRIEAGAGLGPRASPRTAAEL